MRSAADRLITTNKAERTAEKTFAVKMKVITAVKLPSNETSAILKFLANVKRNLVGIIAVM